MAERRFISKQIFNDDIFTDLEVQARLLYAYLILNADDDGFLKNTKQMMFLSGADIIRCFCYPSLEHDEQSSADKEIRYDISK